MNLRGNLFQTNNQSKAEKGTMYYTEQNLCQNNISQYITPQHSSPAVLRISVKYTMSYQCIVSNGYFFVIKTWKTLRNFKKSSPRKQPGCTPAARVLHAILFCLILTLNLLCSPGKWEGLYQISHIHWHFINLGTVVLLNVSKNLDIIVFDKVYCNTLQTVNKPIFITAKKSNI